MKKTLCQSWKISSHAHESLNFLSEPFEPFEVFLIQILKMAEKLAADARNYWIVEPEPGFVIKTKVTNQSTYLNVSSFQCRFSGTTPSSSKLFINVGHCPQLPPPMDDFEEEVLLQKLESDPSQLRIPVSVGQLENTVDKHQTKARKVDVLINSQYYKKRVERSEFYRQLIFMVVIPEIEMKHGLVIDAKEHTLLRKLSVWGKLETQRIRKTPGECLIQKVEPSKPMNYVSTPHASLSLLIDCRKMLNRRPPLISRTLRHMLLPAGCSKSHCNQKTLTESL